MTRLAALGLVLCALAGPAAAAAAPAPAPPPAAPVVIGIADQKEIFGDPLFRSLGMRHARRAVPWDALGDRRITRELDGWLIAARLTAVEPLITFARSWDPERRHVLPTREQMRRAFRGFRARYPWVRSYSVWNEANHLGEPTGRRPEAAATFYRDMRRACPRCQILAADLLDFPNMRRWARAFIAAAGEQPRLWGLHNYVTANRFQLGRTRALLATVTGDVWLTETGGLVSRRNASKVRLPAGARHARDVTRFILGPMVRLSPRIRRVYLYHWSADRTGLTWDSALVGPGGRPRPALAVVRRALRAPRWRGASATRAPRP